MARISNERKQTRALLKKKVFVGLSGGVDSSVAAALLARQGCDVTGVFIKVWQPDWLECPAKDDRLDAMRSAAHLGIPFATLDLTGEYKKEVVEYMIAEYRAGRTPNPDVACNRRIKFGGFARYALSNGADFVATGHYARIRDGRLLRGADENKDQSYFLWTLAEDDLRRTLFPVGELKKPDVRKLAKKFGLPTADKKDSQGLCFMGKVDVKEFLSRFVPAGRRGAVLDRAGKEIGSHPGALFFTLGERHGFTVSGRAGGGAPHYVIAKDMERNTITVSPRREDGTLPLAARRVAIKGENWVRGAPPPPGKKCAARLRYRAPLEPCRVVSRPGASFALFDEPQSAATPGQSLVVYDGEECLGGGVIEEAGS